MTDRSSYLLTTIQSYLVHTSACDFNHKYMVYVIKNKKLPRSCHEGKWQEIEMSGQNFVLFLLKFPC